MRKKIKRSSTLFVAAIAAAGTATALLSGCGSAGSTEDTTQTSETTATTVTTETQISSAVSNDKYKGQSVSGKVVSIEDDIIEIEVSESSGSSGEDVIFELNGNTKYLEQSSSNGPGGAGGDAPQGQPPEMPGGNGSGNGQLPAKPEGEGSSDSGSGSGNGQPPEKPEGEGSENGSEGSSDNNGNSDNNSPQRQPPEMSGGQSSEITKDDIKADDNVTITFDDAGNITEITVMKDGGGQGMPGGAPGGSANIEYTAVKTIESDESLSGETIDSTGNDENAILVKSGANVTFAKGTLTRDSDTSAGGDNASFYGVGAAALVTDGELHVESSTITTDADGGAGVFAYGDGTAYVSDTKITTQQGASGGIHVAGGGTLYAENLEVETNGRSSAAIRSDRGGGTMVVDGGTYTSNGAGSPAIYSTADITVSNAALTANGSEAICIEGLNSITLKDCDLTGNMSDDEQNDHTWNVILYQSMSGDSVVGNSTFAMDGGTLTAKNGGMFYSTNTESTFILKDVDITYADDSEYFLRVSGNNNRRGWGSSGANGADTSFTAISQEMEGKVIWDSISVLDMYMTEGSTLTGSLEKDDSFAGGGTGGECSIYISEDSAWVVTGDSTVTNLYNAGTIKDADGKTVTVKDSGGNVIVNGDSAYTITVDSYSETADLSGAENL